MTRTAALDDLMFHYLALYGRGIGSPLGIVERAGKAPHRVRVTGHPLLTLPEVRHIPRPASNGERILRDGAIIGLGGGRVETLGPQGA